jgi:microcystin-dependent protein
MKSTTRLSRPVRWGVLVALLGLAAAAAHGATPLHNWSSNELLSATDLNDGFKSVREEAAALIPAGIVVAYAGSTAPSGYLLCNGEAVSRSQYPTLYTVIGTMHGKGDGSTTFNLPDYRGRFLRGVDGTAGRDPDSSKRAGPTASNGGNAGNNVGSIQDSQLGAHSHGVDDPGHTHALNIDVALGGLWTFGDGQPNNWGVNQGAHQPPGISAASSKTGLTVASAGGAETRPANAYVNFIIKY